jgi:hypothetical protein
VASTAAVDFRNSGVLSPDVKNEARTPAMVELYSLNEKLGVIPIPDGAYRPAAVNTGEIVGIVCGAAAQWRWEQKVSARLWRVHRVDAQTATVQLLESYNNEVDTLDALAIDVTPSATRRIYFSDNPRIFLSPPGADAAQNTAVGDALVAEFTFRANLYRVGTAAVQAFVEWHSVITIRRIADSGPLQRQWQRVGTNEIAKGYLNPVITEGEARAAISDASATITGLPAANMPPLNRPM